VTNITAVKVKLADAIGDVEKARDIVQTIVREYRRVYRECQVNRITESTTSRYGKVGNWIDRILGENPPLINEKEAEEMVAVPEPAWVTKTNFPKVQKMLDSVQTQLVNTDPLSWAEQALVSDTQNQLYFLEADLKKIREHIGESQSKEKLKQTLINIQENQKRIKGQIEKMYQLWLEDVNAKTPAIGDVGAQFLQKGQTQKVRHTIRWRQYVGPAGKEDELVVKIAASDPSIVVPPELILNYEKNEVSFEYEIRAGNKDGDFKITVTPAVGKPVEVLVTVK
jgi:hypothetical protein